MIRRRFYLTILLALLVGGGSYSVSAAKPAVILPDGRRIEGDEVRATRDGVIFLTTSAGRIEYPKGTRVVMDQPLELVRALELIQKRQHAEAAVLLEKIAADYRFLGWDMKAMQLLTQAYAGQGAWGKAVDMHEQLRTQFSESADDPQLRVGYLNALAGSGNRDKLMPLLEPAIATGPRAEAAQAQMIRARFRMEEGDIEGGLYDYMRTVRFFTAFKELAAEAAFRSAETLDKLGDGELAQALYRQVAKDFPDSAFAAQAKVKAGTKP